MLHVFSRRGSARAADLVAELGEPSNSVSFHVRVLARAGFIKEDPALGRDKRDRVWTLVPGVRDLGSPATLVADVHLGRVVSQALAADHNERLTRALAWVNAYSAGQTTTKDGAFAQHRMHLTESQFVDLMERIEDVLRDIDATPDRTGDERLVWEIDIVAASSRI